MINIIVVAHGHFPSGILSSLELIAGQQNSLVGIDFALGMSAEQLKTAVETELANADNHLILTDLLGGTPFNISSTLSVEHADKNITVLSGLNLAMLMEAVFSRTVFTDMEELVEKVLSSSHKGIVNFSDCMSNQEDDDGFEGGI